jgi:hypothetical protein
VTQGPIACKITLSDYQSMGAPACPSRTMRLS